MIKYLCYKFAQNCLRNGGKAVKERRGRRVAALCLISVLCMLLLSACGSVGKWEYRPITDVNNLEGRRVGVNLGWDADYFLDGRDDMVIVRYDSTADLILAMSYDKVDALAMDDILWKLVSNQSSGVTVVDPPAGYTGYTVYFGPHSKDIMEDFNAFLAEYKQTEEYQDFLRRLDGFDGVNYEGPEIPATGTGRTLRVAYLDGEFPRSFSEPGDDAHALGFDTEAIKRYANEHDMQLEFIPASYEYMVTGLRQGIFDAALGYLSDVYAEDIKNVGLFVSDPMDESPILFVQKTQPVISFNLEGE